MEVLLSGFQTDLGTISKEIAHLQDKSQGMGVKLKNKKVKSSYRTRSSEGFAHD